MKLERKTNLSVVERDGVLVVDSRLVADNLNFDRENFLKIIKSYSKRMELAFGLIAFETQKSERGIKHFAWLTEAQAVFLLTLYSNSERVVECKLKLVKAFSKAKQLINKVTPAQEHEIERLRLELELAKTQERLMQLSQAIAAKYGSELVSLILGESNAAAAPN